MDESFLNGRVMLHPGDCLDVLAQLSENSIDSCVTDPPYHLTSIVKRFGADDAAPPRFKTGAYGGGFKEANGGTGAAFARMSRGFMGKVWDGGAIAFDPATWAAVYRVLKPGGLLLAMGGTRTYHRLACAIEDAGFEIRDTIAYLYGSGFPKSHSVTKGARNAICACEAVSKRDLRSMQEADVSAAIDADDKCGEVLFASVPEQGASSAGRSQLSDHARGAQSGMEGRGNVSASQGQLRERALCEMSPGFDLDGASGRLCDGAPPSDGTDHQAAIASNGMRPPSRSPAVEQCAEQSGIMAVQPQSQERGTWPRCGNCGKPIVPDGLGTALKPACELIVLARKPLSEGTVAANVLRWGTGAINVDGCRVEGRDDEQTQGSYNGSDVQVVGVRSAGKVYPASLGRWPANVAHDGSAEVTAAFPESNSNGTAGAGTSDIYGEFERKTRGNQIGFGDTGSAARFFYTAKADADDRLGSKHPTVKPLDLMQWLVRLVTPKGGTVLDPFAGTGTTGEAAWREGTHAVLIEAEAEYQADIRRRMALALAGPDERQRESIRAKGLPVNYGPLFGFPEAAE